MAGNLSDSITGVYGTSSTRTGYTPATRELEIVDVTARTIKVSGNNHAKWYRMLYSNPNTNITTEIIVNRAIANDLGRTTVAKGTCIIFSQESDNPLVFKPEEGITIISPGQLKAYGKGSTVTLIALEGNKWILGGDVTPNEVVV